MSKAMKLQVLMAGSYDISEGKKIDFQFDEQKEIYIASCEKAAFGILKTLICGTKEHLTQMGNSFSGTAVKVMPEAHYMVVKVPAKRRRKMGWTKKK